MNELYNEIQKHIEIWEKMMRDNDKKNVCFQWEEVEELIDEFGREEYEKYDNRMKNLKQLLE